MTNQQTNECAVGVFEQAQSASQAIDALLAEGVPADCISLITADRQADVQKHLGTHTEEHIENPEELAAMRLSDDSTEDVAKGAGIGGVLGLLAGAAGFALTGFGIIFIAGPLAAGITGGLVGAYLNAMRGWGVHEDHVAAYEKKVADGKSLVVCTGDPLVVARSVRVLREQNADSVDMHNATEEDAPEVNQGVVKD